jgi:hypothetical protein
MPTKNSPGGSYFPYYYKGGELYGLHLGSYFSDEEGVTAMLKAEEAFLKSQHRSIGVWFDLCETRLTDRVIEECVQTVEHLKDQITKLGLVGCSFIARWKISRRIKNVRSLSSLPVRYFDDPEEAKSWLVGKLK